MFADELRRFDSQLFLWFDPNRQRWVVMRLAEKYGSPHKRDWASHEVELARSNGAAWEILVCQDNEGSPVYPSWWIIDYLQQRDTRRINMKHFIREMDERNRKLGEKMEQGRTERLTYQVNANWNHLRDELRGETGFRNYTITK